MRRPFALLVVAAAVPSLASAQLTGYAAGAGKYRVESSLKIVQSMMGQTMEIGTTSRQLLSVSLGGAAPALDLTVVLDSLGVSMTGPAPAPDPSGAQGMRLTGKVTPDGTVSNEKTVDKAGAEVKDQTAMSLRSFLPRLRIGAKVGESWVDSATTTVNQNGIDVLTKTTTTYSYVSDTAVAGGRAARIALTTVGKLTGKGSVQGQDVSVEGDFKNTGTLLVQGGTFIGGTTTQAGNQNVTVEAMGMVIPITQNGTTTIMRLP